MDHQFRSPGKSFRDILGEIIDRRARCEAADRAVADAEARRDEARRVVKLLNTEALQRFKEIYREGNEAISYIQYRRPETDKQYLFRFGGFGEIDVVPIEVHVL